MKAFLFALRFAAILWFIWGLVHIFAGVMTIGQILQGDTPAAIHGITSAVEASTLQQEYPESVSAILKQHGWNLLWAGIVTFVGGIFIWRRNALAVLITAATGGLLDMGYFIYIDLPGLALPPGPQMTWICASAILISLFVYFKTDRLQSLS